MRKGPRPGSCSSRAGAALEGFRSGEGTDDEVVVRELVQNALDGRCRHGRIRDGARTAQLAARH